MRFSTEQSIPEDVATLIGSFNEVCSLHYVDFMSSQYARLAAKRWPLFQSQQPPHELSLHQATPTISQDQ